MLERSTLVGIAAVGIAGGDRRTLVGIAGDRRGSPWGSPDVRPSVTDVALASPPVLAQLRERLGWSEASADNVVCFGVVVSAMGSARPVEVVEALYGVDAVGRTSLARLGLWAARKSDDATVFVDPLAVESRMAAGSSLPMLSRGD